MTPSDSRAIVMLTGIAALIGEDRPLDAMSASATLYGVRAVIEVRREAVSPKTRDAILALIEALREDIAS